MEMFREYTVWFGNDETRGFPSFAQAEIWARKQQQTNGNRIAEIAGFIENSPIRRERLHAGGSSKMVSG
jgi:hypothetical protein